MQTEITLDIDMPYDEYASSVLCERLIYFAQNNILVKNKISLFKRKSSRGNTHVKLIISDNISDLKIYQIRAYLGDDVHRLRLDLIRDFEKREINRLWDSKYYKNSLYEAGNWELVTV